jgi:hypothetical protein
MIEKREHMICDQCGKEYVEGKGKKKSFFHIVVKNEAGEVVPAEKTGVFVLYEGSEAEIKQGDFCSLVCAYNNVAKMLNGKIKAKA